MWLIDKKCADKVRWFFPREMARFTLEKRKSGFPLGGRSRIGLALSSRKGRAVFPSGDAHVCGSLCSLRWNVSYPRSQSPFGKNRLPYTVALSHCHTVALRASSDVKPLREKPLPLHHSPFAIRHSLLFTICYSLLSKISGIIFTTRSRDV